MDADRTPVSPQGSAHGAPSSRGQMTPMRGESVLLVDDDPIGRLLTTVALTERGWCVIEVDSGAKALEQFARDTPMVVVVDALMPGMDGFTVCERLRKMPGGAHVPVLMLTGLDDDASIAHAYEAGATDFFIKTTNQWTLLSERLRYMLRASRLRAELAQSQATLTKAQRIARLGSWSWSSHDRRFRLSEESSAILGLTHQSDGFDGNQVWAHIHADERAQIRAQYRRSRLLGRALDIECRVLCVEGVVRTVHIEAEVDRDDSGRVLGMRGVIQDITQRRQSEEQIRQLANFDTLTGLPNRRCFREQFSASLEHARHVGQPVAVLYLDLDRFKQVNDTLGHQVGDQILREVARRLTQTVRESDVVARASHDVAAAEGKEGLPPQLASADRVLASGGSTRPTGWAVSSVARLGGDEFTVLLTDLSDTQVIERVAARLLDVLREPVQVGEYEVFVSGSIGAALYPRDGNDVDTLIRRADIAMYSVKDDGRNGWRSFNTDMNRVAADRWRVESALHRAIERNELVLEYQPKVNVATGEIVGAEALMRWNHEDRLVPPSAFISVAEESGLIVPITEWAINTVCDQLRTWQQMRVAVVPISVNISSRHIQRANLLQPVQRALERTGVAPQLIELELTETVLMHNLGAALPLLQSLKQLGISLSIDDFGTGYSSLAYLKRLPIDTLKIDRSFVRDLDDGQDGDGAAIVAAVIAMSKSLKLHVVAEGVETTEQMQQLHEQGCELMQGWLFSRSLPHERFLKLLREHRVNSAWRARVDGAPAPTPTPIATSVSIPAAPLHPNLQPLRHPGLSADALPMVHSNGTHFGAPGAQSGARSQGFSLSPAHPKGVGQLHANSQPSGQGTEPAPGRKGS